METFKIKIEQCKEMGGELEDTMSTTYLAAMIQDLGDIVASTIVALLDTDKPYPQTEVYLS